MSNSTDRTAITHIVIQNGYALFGSGDSRDAAIADAAQWMTGENGEPMSVQDVAERIVRRGNSGDFMVLTADHDEFDDYLRNQGGFEQIDGLWYVSA